MRACAGCHRTIGKNRLCWQCAEGGITPTLIVRERPWGVDIWRRTANGCVVRACGTTTWDRAVQWIAKQRGRQKCVGPTWLARRGEPAHAQKLPPGKSASRALEVFRAELDALVQHLGVRVVRTPLGITIEKLA